jgi:hypothetical protein
LPVYSQKALRRIAAKEHKERKKREFKEFKERSQEPESRSQEDRCDASLEGSRFNPCPKTWRISPDHVLRLKNVKATERLRGRQAAPANYPGRYFDPVSLFDTPIEPNAGSFRELPVFHSFRPNKSRSKCHQLLRYALKVAPFQASAPPRSS